MGLKCDDLKSFYNCDLFQECKSELSLVEKQKTANTLSVVHVRFPGNGIFIKPQFLKDSLNVYRKIDSEISFRDINDGTLIVDFEGKLFLVYIELKSGYNDVCKKAIKQIPVSSIKIKSYLRNFSSFNLDNYKELGVIVSFPPPTDANFDSNNNSMVFDYKLQYLHKQLEDDNIDIFNKNLRKNKCAVLKEKYFSSLDQTLLVDDIKFHELVIFHFPVEGDHQYIDISDCLSKMICQ